MSAHALGFDVGLSGVRATVLRADGALVSSARRAHERARFGAGIAEHDPADWLEGLAAAGREAVSRAGGVQLAAVGIAALGPAPVLVDAALEPLVPALLFGLDRRSEQQRQALFGGDSDGGGATLDSPLPKLTWWLEREPELASRATLALDATGFLVAALSDEPVMDSITAADYALPGVESPVPSPAPVDATAIAGRLSDGWAARLGVPAGLPVAAGTYDSFADIAAAGVRRPGDAGLVLGSTMIICRAVERGATETPPGLATSAYPGEGELLGGWTLSGGGLLDWFSGRFGGGEDLVAAASAVRPGGLLALPYASGERTPLWDPQARAAITGISLDCGPADIYRALVDALALALLDHAERLQAELGPCRVWRATGGGTENPLWLQATADALGAPIEVARDAAAGVGPALLALRALGMDPARTAAAVVTPAPAEHERLQAQLPSFRELAASLSTRPALEPAGDAP